MRRGLHRIQAAWIEHEVPQCGYCQTGMIMSAAALLAKNSHPTDADIDASMTNLCRCGTYARVRTAIHALAAALGGAFVLEFSFPVASEAALGGKATEVNAWRVIHPDDRVVVRIARSEMG